MGNGVEQDTNDMDIDSAKKTIRVRNHSGPTVCVEKSIYLNHFKRGHTCTDTVRFSQLKSSNMRQTTTVPLLRKSKSGHELSITSGTSSWNMALNCSPMGAVEQRDQGRSPSGLHKRIRCHSERIPRTMSQDMMVEGRSVSLGEDIMTRRCDTVSGWSTTTLRRHDSSQSATTERQIRIKMNPLTRSPRHAWTCTHTPLVSPGEMARTTLQDLYHTRQWCVHNRLPLYCRRSVIYPRKPECIDLN